MLLSQIQMENDRIVTCCSLATLGKTKHEDQIANHVAMFHVPSWTNDEYLAAIEDNAFYQTVKKNLDAQHVLLSKMLQVEEGVADNEDNSLSIAEEKKQALVSKYYFAGGSCHFMFQYPTNDVIEDLQKALKIP